MAFHFSLVEMREFARNRWPVIREGQADGRRSDDNRRTKTSGDFLFSRAKVIIKAPTCIASCAGQEECFSLGGSLESAWYGGAGCGGNQMTVHCAV